MKMREHLRVIGWRECSTNRFEIGPHGDCKAVTLEDSWLDPRLESSNGAVVPCELFHHFNFGRQPCLYGSPLSQLGPAGARDAGGATRTTTSHGVRRTTRRLESLRTTASSTARPSSEAVDFAAATARSASDVCTSGVLFHLLPDPLGCPGAAGEFHPASARRFDDARADQAGPVDRNPRTGLVE